MLNHSTVIAFCIFVFFQSCIDSNSKSVNSNTNVVFLLVDDLGWNDISCYGTTYHETPNIDQLAKSGIRFTNAYASCPVCSPTRASILTGKNPARLNITDWIPGSDPKNRKLLGTEDKHEMPLEEVSLAETLKTNGYNTAFFGKWHLGEKGFFPEDQGFDLNIGGHSAGQPASYFYPYKNKGKKWDVPGLEGGEEGEYLTDRLTDEAISFMDANKEDPFLLYFAYYNVHTPIQAKEELIEKYQSKNAATYESTKDEHRQERDGFTKSVQDNPTYAAMIHSVDESVGALVSKLESLGIADNTLIVLTSDNGGLSTLGRKGAPTSVVPLRAGKGWLYEGGIRVPTVFSWPGQIQQNIETEALLTSTDFYPTILELLNLDALPQQHQDGISQVAVLEGKEDSLRKEIFWHYPHYHGSMNRPSAAIRSGDYKFIKWYEEGDVELYDLKVDISERNNLVDQKPEKVKELDEKLQQWQEEIGAKFPRPNPDY